MDEKIEDISKKNAGDKIAAQFEKVASVTERVGIPIATFTVGAIVIFLSATYGKNINVLPILGAILIVAALGTYIFFTWRSTVRVYGDPPPIPEELAKELLWIRNELSMRNAIPQELREQIEWMRDEISKQQQWFRTRNENEPKT